MKLKVCQRCGGVYRLESCSQCGWAGEHVADRDRFLAHQRDDILDLHRLEGLIKRLTLEGARAGLEECASDWLEREWILSIGIEFDEHLIVDRALIYAFEAVESGRVKPDNFRGYFNSKARKRFRELVPEELREQEKALREYEARQSEPG